MLVMTLGNLMRPGAFCERAPAATRVSYERGFTLPAAPGSVRKSCVSYAQSARVVGLARRPREGYE
jgi:hypothetical protein